jgi:hypothetical protein
MKGALWNIRDLDKIGRARCLSNFIAANQLDFVGIHESKKDSFSSQFLNSVNENMVWNFVHAEGTKGGILVGVKHQVLEVVSWQMLKFYAVLILKNMRDELSWILVVVYGPTYDDLKLDFISELHFVMGGWPGPTLRGRL